MVSNMFAWSVARIVHCHKTWKSITTNCGSLFPNFVIDGVLFLNIRKQEHRCVAD